MTLLYIPYLKIQNIFYIDIIATNIFNIKRGTCERSSLFMILINPITTSKQKQRWFHIFPLMYWLFRLCYRHR